MCYGNAIIEAMLRAKSAIITVVSGEACSMAGMVSIHGDKRLIESSAYWMAHDIMGGVDGDDYLSKMRKRVEYVSRLQEDMKQMFITKTKLTEKEIDQALYGELWLGAEDCIKKGIADKIV
jgi:ATP-dependent protease ClpP protease subunit